MINAFNNYLLFYKFIVNLIAAIYTKENNF